MNKRLRLRIMEVFGTQSDFALRLGVNESTVSRVVKGRKRLSGVMKGQWARMLGCSQVDIFDEKEE